MSFTDYKVRDISLADFGRKEIEIAEHEMHGLIATIMKIAMIRIPGALAEAGLSGRMLLQVHDELVLECPSAEIIHTAWVVQQVMEKAYPLKVHLQTEARYGSNWGNMRPIESQGNS